MTDGWDYIFRLLRILFGIVIAFWIGTTFFVALNLSSDLSGLEPHNPDFTRPFTIVAVLFATPFTAIAVGKFAIFPMLLAVVLSEIAARRDAFFHMLAGVGMGILLIAYGASQNLPFAGDLFRCLVVVCSCIVGMLIYWLIAGRDAGRFINRPAA
ncbi:hypothetical protein FHS76_000120 [Ochrobactrum daejeonense]|uniref:Uncharacterized protein n=1 Tax=Brucella daejeonensis TaxID=659015 RepID=A0A7W9ATR6_9HYPH|nr:hypothetical protein [Brucella daejeonensis]MBB5700282.1 hypothetical protein [Brucella daejeonensis]NKB78481.1 hypothetical protein [Brucella daejeonensis]